MASGMTSSSFMGASLKSSQAARSRAFPSLTIVASGSKTTLSKQGLNSIKDKIVKQNLMGTSSSMEKKGWTDPQGRKGKGKGVYQFAKKYGANVDGYSPIYTPDIWSGTGDQYTLGKNGLIAWAGVLAIGLTVALVLVVQTSALAQ